MEHGERTRIAKIVGVTPSHIAAIVKGHKKASPELATLLEQATGIRRLAWLYPDEFPNPMISAIPEGEERESHSEDSHLR